MTRSGDRPRPADGSTAAPWPARIGAAISLGAFVASAGPSSASAPAGPSQPVFPTLPGHYTLTYRAETDDSEQAYTLYLPKGPPGPEGRRCPVVFFGVGYGGRATRPPATDWADRYGWIFVGFDGRQRLHYYGIAERDFEQLLFRELAPRLAIDLGRVYFVGSSMGASGAFGLGFRRPDWFAAVGGAGGFLDLDEWYPRWCGPATGPNQWAEGYDGPAWRRPAALAYSVVHAAENGLCLDPYIAAGECDTVNRTFGSRRLHERLAELGIPHRYVEVAGGTHGAGYDVLAILEHFRQSSRPIDPYRPKIWIAANRLELARVGWAAIDGFFNRDEPARLRAELAGPDRLTVVASAAAREVSFRLSPPLLARNGFDDDRPIRVEVEGSTLGPIDRQTAENLVLHRLEPGGPWRLGPGPAEPRAKKPGVEGPFHHVFETPFRIVWADGTGRDETEANRRSAEALAQAYNRAYSAAVKPLAESTLPAGAAERFSLVLVVGPSGGGRFAECAQRWGAAWPMILGRGEFALAGAGGSYSTQSHGVGFIFPSPWNATRYVAVLCGVEDSAAFNFGCFGPLWLPDYFVIRRRDGAMERAGYFDETWRLGPATGAGVATTPAAPPSRGG